MTRRDKLAQFIAGKLPKRLVMWCYYRVLAYATSGKYQRTEVQKITAMDAVDRWIKDFEI